MKLQNVKMEMCALLVGKTLWKDEWKSATMAHLVQCVMITGMSLMHKLSADS